MYPAKWTKMQAVREFSFDRVITLFDEQHSIQSNQLDVNFLFLKVLMFGALQPHHTCVPVPFS